MLFLGCYTVLRNYYYQGAASIHTHTHTHTRIAAAGAGVGAAHTHTHLELLLEFCRWLQLRARAQVEHLCVRERESVIEGVFMLQGTLESIYTLILLI